MDAGEHQEDGNEAVGPIAALRKTIHRLFLTSANSSFD